MPLSFATRANCLKTVLNTNVESEEHSPTQTNSRRQRCKLHRVPIMYLLCLYAGCGLRVLVCDPGSVHGLCMALYTSAEMRLCDGELTVSVPLSCAAVRVTQYYRCSRAREAHLSLFFINSIHDVSFELTSAQGSGRGVRFTNLRELTGPGQNSSLGLASGS
jgi:hypothetical protein